MSKKKKNKNRIDKREPLYTYVKNHYWSVWKLGTATLSTTCRQLGLGIGGICFAIRSSNNCYQISLSTNLILIFLVLFFLFDAAQYLASLIKYKDLAENYNQKILQYEITNFEQLSTPKNINRLSNLFFTLKLFILGLSSLIFISLLL